MKTFQEYTGKFFTKRHYKPSRCITYRMLDLSNPARYWEFNFPDWFSRAAIARGLAHARKTTKWIRNHRGGV